MQSTNPDRLLSTRDAAEYLGVHPGTLRIARSNSKKKLKIQLPTVRVGGRVKYRLSDLLTYIEANRKAAA